MNNKKLKPILALILVLGLVLTHPQPVEAQCPMCKMSAESNLKNGGRTGKGLNNGILYLFAAPYVMIGAIGYVWYRNRKKKQDA